MKRRGLFLDRDGVINEELGFVGKISDFVFMSGVFNFLSLAQDNGYRLFVVTNQSGVARGHYTAHDYDKLTEWMLGEFKKEGIYFDAVMHSYEKMGEAIERYNRDSFWRKPAPGMILEASLRHRIDLSRSVLIGDKKTDIEAAESAGVGQSFCVDAKNVDFQMLAQKMGLLC